MFLAAMKSTGAKRDASFRRAHTGESGSTAWGGAFRSRLYLSYPEEDGSDVADNDKRVLTRKKANWAKIGETIEMRWHDGVFITKPPPAGILGSIERRTCERVFLDLLDQMTAQKQWVSSNVSARNYAPRLFSKTIPAASRENFKLKDLEQAMHRLFKDKAIINEEYGRKSDERYRIVRAHEPSKKAA
jgi:RecA-family ATPase